jgi:gliding motility-associated lipoprotein GldH
MKKLFTIIILSLLLSSCRDAVYEDYYDFSIIQWEQTDTPVFEFEIPKKSKYNIIFALRYIEGFPYKNMYASVLMNDKNNNAALKKIKFQVVDDNNNYIGDVAGNMWDIEYTVFKDTLLEKGNYKIQLEQLVEEKTLPFVYDVGIIVEESKK